jgi:hypothetical protein
MFFYHIECFKIIAIKLSTKAPKRKNHYEPVTMNQEPVTMNYEPITIYHEPPKEPNLPVFVAAPPQPC